MRFALIDNKRVEAEPTLSGGSCPGCNKPVIAKCGTQKVHHWAHVSKKICDTWWESETEWHRSWKNNFPVKWQEIFIPDEGTGEKHIADVRTDHGLVIEFQHSHIPTQERIMRENFYKNMVWVVDGSRNKRDFPRFMKRNGHFKYDEKGVFRVDNPEECFPTAWLDSSVPVIFDFKGTEPGYAPIVMKNVLYCLFPIRVGNCATVAEMSRETFIRSTIDGEWNLRASRFIDKLNRDKQILQAQDALLRQLSALNDIISKRSITTARYQKRRRF